MQRLWSFLSFSPSFFSILHCSLPSNATEMPPIFPCWTNTVKEFLKSASADTKPAPWQVTFDWVDILNVLDVLDCCERTKSINKNVECIVK